MPRYESRVARIDSDITTFPLLSMMSWIATKLYNTALWNAKETWNKTGKIPSGFDLQKCLLANYYHSFLPAHTYQHPAHQVGNAFKVMDTNTILLTPTAELKQEISYPYKKFSLKMQWGTAFPKNGQVMAIDLGMRNPIVSIDEHGNTDIFKGGKILSDLHYWNKEKARVQTDVMGRTKGKKKSSLALRKMSQHGVRQVKHAIHSMTNKVVELCVQRNVKEVVVGDLTGIKKNQDGTGKNWSDKPSQNWQQFPIQQVVAQLDYKLARHSIQLKKQDERGTSKGRCSLCQCTDRSKMHRTHRGLFLCKNCNTIQNSDVNGAITIKNLEN
jgi:IS605 OrfB family transposase